MTGTCILLNKVNIYTRCAFIIRYPHIMICTITSFKSNHTLCCRKFDVFKLL